MSTIRIQLLKTVDISKPNASKTYQQMVVTHQEIGKDKPDGKKIFDFTTPKEVWETLKAAPALSFWEVDRQKDKKEGKYWEWIAIRPSNGDAAATPASQPTATAASTPPTAANNSPATARVGNWETPEERAAKQVYIVRQSSLSNAIDYYKSIPSDTHTEEDVIRTAKVFENYVFDKGVAGLTNDFPE